MIQASELRIRNIVGCKKSNDAGTYQIEGIKGWERIFKTSQDKLNYEKPFTEGKFEGSNYWDERLVEIIGGSRSGEILRESQLKPIPLTGNWLIRLGFKKGDDGDLELFPLKYFKELLRYNGKSAPIFVSDFGDDSHYDLPISHIKYVHQLQNLYFALTGEELTVK